MPAPLLPQASTPLSLELVTAQAGVILLKARTRAEAVTCPLCRWETGRVHSRYRRRLLDLPWQGQSVRIEIAARKFFCDNPDCPRRIFTEPLPGITRRYARKTSRLADALQELVLLVGGEAAARIAQTFGLLLSPDSLLKLAHKAPIFHPPSPRVLGVDDFAFRKGHTYGTILIDLERRCPIDLLPDRESKTVEAWLKAHPSVQIVSRDRAEAYRSAITTGAPQAIQVADRWHLLKNLGDALERLLIRLHPEMSKAIQEQLQGASSSSMAKPSAEVCSGSAAAESQKKVQNRAERDKTQRREKRHARFEQVQRLYQEGTSIRAIAQQLGMSRPTVAKFASAPSFPEIGKRTHYQSRASAFSSYLKQRWEGGCHNRAQLYREIQNQGYSGGLDAVERLINRLTGYRGRGGNPTIRRRSLPSCRRLVFLLTNEERGTQEERSLVESLCTACPEVSRAREIGREFCRLVRERDAQGLDSWQKVVSREAPAELARFSTGLTGDGDAVRAALSLEWSNGQTEGQVNRLKLVKRQMYGRGSFTLLRARVLHRAR